MNQKGFTLIELLAVIVILAIVSIITIPIVVNIVENVKKNAFLDNAYGMMDAAKINYTENILENKQESKIYTFPFEQLSINHKNTKGTIAINEDGLSLALYNETWCALKGTHENKIQIVKYKEGSCTLSETEIKEPMIQITTPNPNYVKEQKIDIEIITGKQNTVSSFTYQIDGKEDTINGTKTTFLLKTDGIHNVKVEVDNNGKKITKEVEYKIDAIAPIIEIENATIESNLVSTYNLLEGVRVTDNIDGSIDVNKIKIEGNLSSFVGEYEITYQISDNAGNIASKKRIITVTESEGPILNFSNPGNNGWTKNIDVLATATDVSNISTFTYEVIKDNVSLGEKTGIIEGKNGTATISLNENGTYVIILKASDIYGNTSSLTSSTYKIDKTEPQITSSYSTNNYILEQGISKPISDLYDVTYGPSGGSVSCKNESTTITDLKSLAIGEHSLTCTASSNTGITKNITMKININKIKQTYKEEDIIKDDLEVYYSAFKNSASAHQTNPSNWYDLSGNNRHGTFQNTTWNGNKLTFNGNNSAVLMPVLKYPQITLETTFTTGNNITSNQQILNNLEGGGCTVFVGSQKIWGMCHINGSYQSIGYAATTNHRYSTALTYDGTNMKFYVDGTLVGTYTSNAGIHYHNTTIWAIGANPYGNIVNMEYFEGDVYSARIYSRPLSNDEIKYNKKIDQSLFDLEQDTVFQNLEVYYSASKNSKNGHETNPNNWYDLSGNNRHGTFQNTTWNGNKLTFNGNSAVLMPVLKYPQITLQATFKTGNNMTSNQQVLDNVEGGGCGLAVVSMKVYGYCHINGSYRSIEFAGAANHKYNTAVTYDGTNLKFYVDGSLAGTYTSNVGIHYHNTTIWAIGANPSGNTVNMEYFGGDVYSARIYSRALSPNEIKRNSEVDQRLYPS